MSLRRTSIRLSAGSRGVVTHHKPSYAESQTNRTFFLTVLAATATKRDAKAYIEKYQKPYNTAKSVNVKSSRSLKEFVEAADGALIDVEPSLARSSPLRVALVTIRDPAETSTSQLEKIANTLGQLHRLGLHPMVLIATPSDQPVHGWGTQVNRFAQILESFELDARPISEGLFSLSNDTSGQKPMHKKRIVSIYDTRVLKAPVSRRQIPVIRTIAVDQTGRKRRITADSAMKALCSAFGAQPTRTPFQNDMNRSALMIDKLIIIDKVGGILAPQRKEGSHVFINLDQEALQLQRELATLAEPEIADKHLRNLDTCKYCLDVLSDTASAVITTPTTAGSIPGVQHPLIHNLLTDKPMFSPSLPVSGSRTPVTTTTILRKGVSVLIIRDLTFPDPRVDLEKLVALINDSFGRKLDVTRYLARINGRIDALIVAGDYHGAAIITTEFSPLRHAPSATPHAVSDHDERLAKERKKVAQEIPTTTTTSSSIGSSTTTTKGKGIPYLDKFAVLRSKQGSGGVADILFNAMMGQYQDELIWRSRDANPVNKWYFERSLGTLLVPESVTPVMSVSSGSGVRRSVDRSSAGGGGLGLGQEERMRMGEEEGAELRMETGGTEKQEQPRWRLFWTKEPKSRARFEEYLSIARSIKPTWLP